jgi:hypothetical protein
MKKFYYEKRGNRYFPVSEYDSEVMDAFPPGDHLVSVRPGSTSRRYKIDPDFAPMIAAGLYAQDQVAEAVIKASELRPQKTPLTEPQLKAWRMLADSLGDDLAVLNQASAFEITDAAVKAMQQEAEKLMQNSAVRQAYEHFMLMCKLAKDVEKRQ